MNYFKLKRYLDIEVFSLVVKSVRYLMTKNHSNRPIRMSERCTAIEERPLKDGGRENNFVLCG